MVEKDFMGDFGTGSEDYTRAVWLSPLPGLNRNTKAGGDKPTRSTVRSSLSTVTELHRVERFMAAVTISQSASSTACSHQILALASLSLSREMKRFLF